MNLKYLYEIQDGLIAHIEKKHPSNGENRLPKKFLATLVELGEAANDTRCFKFWSTDQKPKETTLEELVDFLHFLLELGIEFDYKIYEVMKFKMENVTNQFLEIFDVTVRFIAEKEKTYYKSMFMLFFGLVEMLGFTEEEVEQAYLAKNRENHNRQLNSY